MEETNLPMKIPLHNYQRYAKDFLLITPYCGLFLEMGLGKTAIVLEAIWELNPTDHVLIIAPKTIARCTWANEIKKWDMGLRTKSLVVNKRGKQLSKKVRTEIYQHISTEPPTVFFINRELIPDLVQNFPGSKWPFKMVIIDESQSFKTYNTARFKAMKTVRPFIDRLVLLTGSPTPNGLEDLWTQIWLLDMGQRLGKNITAYREEFFLPGLIVNNHPVSYRPKRGAEDEIYNRVNDIVISMKNKYIQLPQITYNPVLIDMDADEMERYKEFMRDSVLEIQDGEYIEAVNAAVLSAKLSQMASGALYTDAEKHEYLLIHQKKLEVCEYIINNTQGNVIIAYHFVSDADMLMKYLTDKGLNPVQFDGTPEMETAWNEGKLPIILLQPASCGRGLNLQKGGSCLIWYTLPWSLEDYEQTNARIYRQGQTEPTIIHQLMMRNTIDTKILKALNDKDLSQQRLLQAVEATVYGDTDDTDNTDDICTYE